MKWLYGACPSSELQRNLLRRVRVAQRIYVNPWFGARPFFLDCCPSVRKKWVKTLPANNGSPL